MLPVLVFSIVSPFSFKFGNRYNYKHLHRIPKGISDSVEFSSLVKRLVDFVGFCFARFLMRPFFVYFENVPDFVSSIIETG